MIDNLIKRTPEINRLLENKRVTGVVTFVNPYSYYKIKEYNKISQLDYIYIDGILLLKLFNFVNGTKIKRHSFDYSSIAKTVFNYSIQNKMKIGLIGSKDYEIEQAVKNIRKKHPGIDISYFHSGYFSSLEEKSSVIDSVIKKSDNIICGLGTPAQEELALDIKIKSNEHLIFTCGGFFTQTASRADFYYPWIKRYNLMWLQRIVLYKHVRKRFFIDYPKFIVRFISENLMKIFTRSN